MWLIRLNVNTDWLAWLASFLSVSRWTLHLHSATESREQSSYCMKLLVRHCSQVLFKKEMEADISTADTCGGFWRELVPSARLSCLNQNNSSELSEMKPEKDLN